MKEPTETEAELDKRLREIWWDNEPLGKNVEQIKKVIAQERKKAAIEEWERAKPHLTDDNVAHSVTNRLEDDRGSVVWVENMEQYISDRIAELEDAA